jgi:hypothetical protein
MASSYDDLATPDEMAADCRAVGARLHLDDVVRRVRRPAPSLYFDEQPDERPKRDVEISAAAARLAGALHFHLE